MNFKKFKTKAVTESISNSVVTDDDGVIRQITTRPLDDAPFTGYVDCGCCECGKMNHVKVTFDDYGKPFNTTSFTCDECGTKNKCKDPHKYDADGYIVEEVETQSIASVSHAAAIEDRNKNKEQLVDTMEEFNKAAEEFVDENHNREVKTETTKEMKTMHLSESLFKPITEAMEFTNPEDLGKGCCAPTLYIPDDIETTVEYAQGDDLRYANIAKSNIQMLLDRLAQDEQTFINFDTYWKKHYAFAMSVIKGTRELLNGGVASDVVEEDVESTKPKRVRSENEKKWIGDYSSEDLWLAVYDELSSEVDNEGKGQQVDKQIRARRGQRYEKVFPHGDNDIIIYAPTVEDFAFAKQVAAHYGVVAEEPREDKNKRSNSFYKYSMIIRIPAEKLYKSA